MWAPLTEPSLPEEDPWHNNLLRLIGEFFKNCDEMRFRYFGSPWISPKCSFIVEIVSICFLDSLGAVSEPTSRRNVCKSN